MSDDTPILDDELIYRLDDDGVAWITLNRPQAHNAMTPSQRNRMIELLEEASASLHVRCVVLGASGEKAFCTGADLRAGGNPTPPRPDGAPDRAAGDVARMIQRGAQRLIGAIIDCEKPVICAVNGTAAGLGAHLAWASDIVIASDNAKFIEVFIRRGIAPDAGGAYLLPRLIGVQKTKELIFFGDDVSATDALAMGLVNRVVPFDQLGPTVGEWARRLAGQPTKAISLGKWLINRSLESDRRTAFDEEAWAQEVVVSTHDAGEGVAAFKERRSPEFRGW
ncbi:MAG TPA: enoyl-CoA hydratase-related protein [Acidimicrobiales bacterium]|jgi:2-(1,2-epoxy-1,2-dihydrophenyl)acetyl-CoA isomerase